MISLLKQTFLLFLDEHTNPLSEEIDIKKFMVSHFKKPNPRLKTSINSTDKGVVFLKHLKSVGLIAYDDIALDHVNNWCVDTANTIKRWFDSLHEPLYVNLTELYYSDFKPRPFWGRLFWRNFTTNNFTPTTQHGNNSSIQTGKILNKKSTSEFVVGFVYALMALLIGSVILKILGVI